MIEIFHLLRTVFFLIPCIAVYTLVLGVLSVGSSFVDRSGHFAHRCARAWAWLILATTGVDVEVEGLERLDPEQTYVFVANHQSIYDIPVVFWWVPFQLRIIAKDSLGGFPMLGMHLRRTGHMLVDRSRANQRGVFEWAGALASKGLSLIVFPEGTRSADGRVGVFKGGSIYLAMRAGLPIAPLSIVGSRHVMRKGQLTTRPGRVRLVVHEPIATSALDEPPTAEVRAMAARIRAIVRTAPDEEAGDRTGPP